MCTVPKLHSEMLDEYRIAVLSSKKSEKMVSRSDLPYRKEGPIRMVVRQSWAS